jgi:hypothetical protein
LKDIWKTRSLLQVKFREEQGGKGRGIQVKGSILLRWDESTWSWTKKVYLYNWCPHASTILALILYISKIWFFIFIKKIMCLIFFNKSKESNRIGWSDFIYLFLRAAAKIDFLTYTLLMRTGQCLNSEPK